MRSERVVWVAETEIKIEGEGDLRHQVAAEVERVKAQVGLQGDLSLVEIAEGRVACRHGLHLVPLLGDHAQDPAGMVAPRSRFLSV
jgi:hypothetical protein